MKNFKSVIIVTVMLLVSLCANAQNGEKRKALREQMIEVQAKHIAQDLALDDKTYNRFTETYIRYKKEMWAIAPKRCKKDRKLSETEEEAAQHMRQRFEQSQKMLDIRDKYYKEFSKFMTQKQIELMYDKERKIMQRLSQRHKKGPHRRK